MLKLQKMLRYSQDQFGHVKVKKIQKRQCNNKITCLKSSKIEHETSKLLSTKLFYENLFKSKNIKNDKITDYLKDVQLENILSEDDAKLCENYLSSEQMIVSSFNHGFINQELSFSHRESIINVQKRRPA